MSMWLNMARVSPQAFDAVLNKPDLLEPLFFGGGSRDELDAAGIGEDQVAGVDYRSAHAALIAMAEATGEDVDEDMAVFDDLGASGELDFEMGYGPAFFVSPEAVRETAVHSVVVHMDDEAAELLATAAGAGDYLIGLIS